MSEQAMHDYTARSSLGNNARTLAEMKQSYDVWFLPDIVPSILSERPEK